MKTAIEILADILNIHADPLIEDATEVEAFVSEIKNAMEVYSEDKVIGFSKWKDESFVEDGFAEYANEPLYLSLLDIYYEGKNKPPYPKKLFTIKDLYQKFKEEQQ